MNVLPMDGLSERPMSNGPIANQRIAGFDAVRAFAVIGVVLLHACTPYAVYPMPGLCWPVRDVPSMPVDVVMWSIELFIMPLFLVLAGILAAQTLVRRGAGELVRGRANRLLKPLAFGMLVVMPADLYVWLCGWVAEGLIEPVKLRSLKFEHGIDRDLWGLSHLWFLQYTFTYVVIAAVGAGLHARMPRWPGGWPTNRMVATALVALGFAAVLLRPEVVWGFQHAFLPVPTKWLFCGSFFFGGLMLSVVDPELNRLRTATLRWLVPVALLLAFTVTLGRWHLAQLQAGVPQPGLASEVGLAASTVVSGWAVTCSVLGIAIRYVQRVPRSIAYLSAASFWIYLVHHPLVGLVHIDLKYALPMLHPILKTVLATSVVLAVSLLSYEAFLRRTALGRWLGISAQSKQSRLPGGQVNVGATEQRAGVPVARRRAA